jgi:hypothetical protein
MLHVVLMVWCRGVCGLQGGTMVEPPPGGREGEPDKSRDGDDEEGSLGEL